MTTTIDATGFEFGTFAEALGVVEDAADGFIACDSWWRIVFLNSAAGRLCGGSKSELLGTPLWESPADLGGSEFERECCRVMAERKPGSVEWFDGQRLRWLDARVSPAVWGGISIWLRDITSGKRAGLRLTQDEAVLERQLAEIECIYADAPVGLAAIDRDGRYLRINRRLAEINGLPVEAHYGRTFREAVPDLAPALEPIIQRVLNTGEPIVDVEFVRSTLDRPGVERYWLANFYPLKTAGNGVVGVNVVLQEITERKQFELALREKTDELREAQRLAGVGSWIWDIETDTVTWSDELYRLSGHDPSEGIAGFSGLANFHNPESWERLRAAVRAACENGAPYEIEAESVRPDGRRCWRTVRGEALRDASGRVVKLRGTAQDVTERKRAEDELRMAHAELAAIHAHAPMVYLVVDEALRLRKVNEAAARFAGRREAEMLGMRPGNALGCLNALQHPDGCGSGPSCGCCTLRAAVVDTIDNHVRHDNVEACLPVKGKDGPEERWFLAFTAPLELGAREALVCALDITDRKLGEQALRNSEYWLNESQRISQTCSYVLDCAKGTWTCSLSLREIFGIEANYPRTFEGWKALLHPEDRESLYDYLVNKVLGQGAEFDREYRIVRPADGRVRWLHGRGAVVRDSDGAATFMAGTIQDVTERRAVEEQLRQAQKLEGLGRLAGGIAHDFNNLLTVINGYGDMLLRDVKEQDRLREPVVEIRKAGQRAAELTGQLLTFSRKQIVEPKPLDLNRLICDNLAMLQQLAGEDIAIETSLQPSLGRVMADGGQMHQVLLNLVGNARDAMPRGGRLTIVTSNRESEDAGQFILLSVTDTGMGMNAETREHLFDPFFTTKGQGGGTGLGLATVHGIVRQAGGSISVQSEPGCGATFVIYLPRTEATVVELPHQAPAAMDLRGTETVLVVEDQESVRKLAVKLLSRQGYRILEASQGDEAILLAAGYAGPIHLLLTDVVMPRMTGRELAERLGQARAAMKVLYMSGYAEDVIASRGLLDPGLYYLAKPFAAEALARKVREALGPPVGPATSRVLVVDDESGVRGLFQRILAGAGYEVLLAADGNEALEMVRAERLDLVLTDLVMPEREGIEVIQSMRKERPELKIIAMSGAFAGGFLKVAKLLGANATLAKPVSPGQLLAAVRDVLG